jgi:hypothetical protein
MRLRSIEYCRNPEESGRMPYRISGDKYDPSFGFGVFGVMRFLWMGGRF